LGLIVTTLVVLHAASGILDLVYMGVIGVNSTMVANAVLRFVVAGVLFALWRTTQAAGSPARTRAR
jgi:hypothetical protein